MALPSKTHMGLRSQAIHATLVITMCMSKTIIDNPLYVSEVLDQTDSEVIPSGTTNFTDAAPVQIATMSHLSALDSTLLHNAYTGKEETIHDFLAKPYPYQSGSLSTSDTSTSYAAFDPFNSVLAVEPFLSKLKGFLGIRADIIIRLVVNGNRFQQGRYMVVFCPIGGADTSTANTTEMFFNMRSANLTTITQLPHVEIDIASQTEAILRIPYVSVFSHHPVTSSTKGYGYVRIIPYSPLVAVAGSTTATYDLFVSYENVDLAAPCYPQSGKFVPKGKNASHQEQASKGLGPVSSAAKAVGNLSNIIGNVQPSLKALAAPVSWACDIVAGVASVFGWSNPVNLEHAYKVVTVPTAYSNNCDNIDQSLPISLFSGNMVEVLPGFAGTDFDEMSIDYIKAKPAFYRNVTWSTSQNADVQLFSDSLSPGTFLTQFSSGLTSTILCFTPVGYLSRFFQYYRGGIRFTFKMVKTEFHSGRLLVVFNPTNSDTSTFDPTNAQSTYCHREIIDIREGNTFEFIVPYVSLTPYKSTNGNGSSIGTLQLRILNPLIAPSTVSSTINILVEVAGAPDMEFAVPQNHSMNVATVYNPQSGDFVPKRDMHSITTGVIGNSSLLPDNHISARACMGEKIVSLLSLLKKDDFTNTITTSAAYTVVDPFALPILKTTAAVPNGKDLINDNLSLISCMYLMSRGGVRLRLRVAPGTSMSGTFQRTDLVNCTSATSNYTGIGNGAVSVTSQHQLSTWHNTAEGAAQEVQVPQYHRYHSRLVSDSFYNTLNYGIVYSSSTPSRIQVQFTTPASAVAIGRQASDDFQLGYFLGVPPILLSNVA